MNNFTYQNPTQILFGKGQIENLKNLIPHNQKVLITYGGGSIKQNGVYEQTIQALANHQVFEFAGIEPNPTFETLMKAVVLVKKEKIDFILAVGGGSVIDGTKFISLASCFEGENAWDLMKSTTPLNRAIPFGTILTLPATGSEMNCGFVITKKETSTKISRMTPLTFPVFSILDPETTYSMPIKQISNGIVDAYVHVVEQYLTYPNSSPIQDRFSESILQTLIEVGPKALQNPKDYETRASLMWSCTMALNGLIGVGVPQDWSTHMIGHELTALYHLDHAQTLAIVLPGNLFIMLEDKKEKLLQYAERVWNITEGSDREKCLQAIEATRNFFEQVGVKTKLSDYSIAQDQISVIAHKLKEQGFIALGEKQKITPLVVEQILNQSI